MKLAVALLLTIVAPTAAFVPSSSCRGVITASRTRSITALRAHGDKDKTKHLKLGQAVEAPDQEEMLTAALEQGSPRKAFSAAPTFEEFLKFKQNERGETELKLPK